MRKQIALALTLGLLLGPSPIPADAKPSETAKTGESGAAKTAEKLNWLAFDKATEQALKENKHVVVDIYTTWCGWCKVMDRQTYGDPQVAAYLRSNFVLAKVNGESSSKLHWKGQDLSERQFARAVGVTGYPATYFFKPNAELLGGVSGFIKSPDFLIYAQFVNTRWYEKGKIQAYVDSLRNATQ